MMKITLCLFCAFLVIFSLSACGKSTANRTSKNNTKTVADILNEAKKNDGTENNTKADEKNSSQYKDISDVKCDIDLTVMNTNMVYAEVYNMMATPDDYIGKRVKMKGSFSVYKAATRNYYACIIADATACCSQGIEFVLKDAHKYPDEYPDEGAEITVTGKFETYYEGDLLYCQLSDAIMSK